MCLSSAFCSVVDFDKCFIFDNDINRSHQRYVRKIFKTLQYLTPLKRSKRRCSGYLIASELSTLLGDRRITVRIVNDGCCAISPKFILNLDIARLKTARVGCVVGTIDADRNMYRIGSSTSPAHVTLGHELIHIIDFLKHGKKKYMEDTTSIGSGLWKFKDIPRDRINDLWAGKTSEQRAVIGSEDIKSWDSCYTEFMLRIESGLSPRYAYQCSKEHFYESKAVIEKIMKAHLKGEWEAVLGRVIRNTGVFYRFNDDKAETSTLGVGNRVSRGQVSYDFDETLDKGASNTSRMYNLIFTEALSKQKFMGVFRIGLRTKDRDMKIFYGNFDPSSLEKLNKMLEGLEYKIRTAE